MDLTLINRFAASGLPDVSFIQFFLRSVNNTYMTFFFFFFFADVKHRRVRAFGHIVLLLVTSWRRMIWNLAVTDQIVIIETDAVNRRRLKFTLSFKVFSVMQMPTSGHQMRTWYFHWDVCIYCMHWLQASSFKLQGHGGHSSLLRTPAGVLP